MSSENGNGTPAIVHQAEQNLILSLLGAPGRICEVAGTIEPEDFLDPTYRMVFKAILALDQRREVIDSTNLHIETRKRVPLSWFAEQAGQPPTTAFLAHHAKRLSTIARNRVLGVTLGEVAATALLEPLHEEHVERAEAALFAIMSRTKPKSATLIAESVKARRARLWDESSRGRGISCGLTDIDDLLGGLERGALIVIGARPSMGKSTLALVMAYNIAVSGKRVAFFSLEMDEDVVTDRLFSIASDVPLSDMRSNEMTRARREEADARGAEIEHLPIYVDATHNVSVAHMRGEVRRMSRREPLDAIFVDYLQLVKPSDGDNRVEQVGSISRGLKLLAREFRVPVIAPAQLNRKADDKGKEPPTLSDLRESGSIEADADVVLFIHRPKKGLSKTPNEEVDILCGKNRNGPTNMIRLQFACASAKFLSASTGHQWTGAVS